MKSYIFTNTQRTINKEYKTDFVNGDNFTVHDIQVWGNMTDDEFVRLGVNFAQEPSSISAFKAKATSLNLMLRELDFGAKTETTLVAEGTELAITTSSLDAGTQGTAEVTVVTIPATAGATQGDYVILYNKAGDSFAAWLDIDADGTEPSGPLYLATDYQIQCGIATGDTAAQAAAKVIAAVEADSNWTGFDTIVDNADGTFDLTASALGDTEDAVPHNAAESGAGSISVSITDGTGDYSVTIASEGGLAPYTYELDSTSDVLVAGLTLSSAGVISGVPTTTGTPDIVIKVTDSVGQTALSDPLTLTIT